MAKLPPLGKIDAEFFNEVIFPRLGAKRDEVVVGPQHGMAALAWRYITKHYMFIALCALCWRS